MNLGQQIHIVILMRGWTYIAIFVFIGAWWAAAQYLLQAPTTSTHESEPISNNSNFSVPSLLQQLSPFKREALILGLSGNTVVQAQLILSWDHDAKILISKSVSGVQRLPEDTLKNTISLAYQLINSSQEQQAALRNAYRDNEAYDDLHNHLSLRNNFTRFLPQTYASAEILLALQDPQNITAIPSGFRKQSALFTKSYLEAIQQDSERYQPEKNITIKPDVGIVSVYSNPYTQETLAQQGVKLFFLDCPSTIEKMLTDITRLGHVINRAPESLVMKVFIEAALMNIENRLQALMEMHQNAFKTSRPLLVYRGSQWTVPTEKTVVQKLLKRLNIHDAEQETIFSAKNSLQWLQPIQTEQIVAYNPTHLYVVTDPNISKTWMTQQPFASLSAVKNHKVRFIDEEILQSVSQQIILAYFDLFEAIKSNYSP